MDGRKDDGVTDHTADTDQLTLREATALQLAALYHLRTGRRAGATRARYGHEARPAIGIGQTRAGDRGAITTARASNAYTQTTRHRQSKSTSTEATAHATATQRPREGVGAKAHTQIAIASRNHAAINAVDMNGPRCRKRTVARLRWGFAGACARCDVVVWYGCGVS